MLEDIQNELQAILGKYPEVESLIFRNGRNQKWKFEIDGNSSYFQTLTQAIEHLETKYPNR